MTLHSFRSLSPCWMSLADWYTADLSPRPETYRPFLPFANAVRAANASVKLSSGGTLATFLSQKHDIALITPMTKLVILEYPDPRLRKKAAPVAQVDDALRQFIDNLLDTMYSANGVGLAATQVDVHKRVIVLDVSETRDQPLV